MWVGVVLLVCVAARVPGESTEDAGKPVRFEVASVRPVAEKDRGYTSIGEYGKARYTMKAASLQLLITFAYNVPADRLLGAPKGLEDVYFDVDVKSEGDVPLTYERMQAPMQELLKERFGMVVHLGEREDKGYGLMVAKGGPKLVKATAEGGSAYIMRDQFRASGVTMNGLAGILTAVVHQPVEDATGIEGKYDVLLRYAPQDGSGNAEGELPSLFPALKDQLGLELKPRMVKVKTLVIEHVNKTATED